MEHRILIHVQQLILFAVFFSLWKHQCLAQLPQDSFVEEYHFSEPAPVLSMSDSKTEEDIFVFIDDKGKCRVLIPIPTHPDSGRVWRSNGTYILAGVASMGILYALPESVTNWDKDELTFGSIFDNWKKHVSEGPVVDEDNFFLNYVMHPYFGSVYYLTLRGAGYKWWQSALYSAGMSTFFWEYGIEALAETPSLQDIIITPVGGTILGEGLFQAKKAIKAKDDRIANSRVLGRISLILIDPLNEVQDSFTRAHYKKQSFNQIKLESNFSLIDNQVPGILVQISWND